MKWLEADLAQLARGRGWRAALILLVAHVIPGVLAMGIWAFGLLSFFDHRRWIPNTLVIVFTLASLIGLFLRFGFWGTLRTFGQGGGEEYTETFSRGVGFALGWWRWFLQIVAACLLVIPALLTVGNAQLWQLTGTPELNGLADKAATMPFPNDWRLGGTEALENGPLGIRDSQGGTSPNGWVAKTFTVPATYSLDDLKSWLDHPDWKKTTQGTAFGALERPRCDQEWQWCKTHLIPAPGDQPEYFIRAELNDPAYDGDDTTVEVRLQYRKYAAPDYEVGDVTVTRAETMPVPPDWVRYDIVEGKTSNGESFTQFFSVPDDFTPDDLRTWMTDTTWTNPASGEPFGAIDVDLPCREISVTPQDAPKWMCTATGPKNPDGPIEALRASLSNDHIVQLNLSRNG